MSTNANDRAARHSKLASRNFSATTLAALRAKGITLSHTTWLPDASGSFANGETGYMLSDGRLRTFSEVLALASG